MMQSVLLFGMPGPLELALILVVVLLVFGSSRLPELGHALGKAIRSFKAGMTGVADEKDEKNEATGANTTMETTEKNEQKSNH